MLQIESAITDLQLFIKHVECENETNEMLDTDAVLKILLKIARLGVQAQFAIEKFRGETQNDAT